MEMALDRVLVDWVLDPLFAQQGVMDREDGLEIGGARLVRPDMQNEVRRHMVLRRPE